MIQPEIGTAGSIEKEENLVGTSGTHAAVSLNQNTSCMWKPHMFGYALLVLLPMAVLRRRRIWLRTSSRRDFCSTSSTSSTTSGGPTDKCVDDDILKRTVAPVWFCAKLAWFDRAALHGRRIADSFANFLLLGLFFKLASTQIWHFKGNVPEMAMHMPMYPEKYAWKLSLRSLEQRPKCTVDSLGTYLQCIMRVETLLEMSK